MAFKLKGTGTNTTKTYLFPMAYGGPLTDWVYVSADPATTVDGSGYISDSTDDGQEALSMLRIGDRVWAYQVASIDDSRSIEDDCKAGVTDLSLHLVLDNTGSVIDLSDDLLSATPTYGD